MNPHTKQGLTSLGSASGVYPCYGVGVKVHFIGIGGIGVSALARYYLGKGHRVSGSDLVLSEITERLKKAGAKIVIGKHFAKNLSEDTDLVIYSPAVLPVNPEVKEAKKLGIKIQSYPEALGELTKKYFTIAVSGTHGKSTTVAMVSLILMKAGLDPTVIVGTKLKEFKMSNFRMGKSKYLVIEADEWQASFLRYFPKIIVLTSIEKEHLDYYKDLNHILKTYKKYISHLPKAGILVVNKDDKNISKLRQKARGYSFKQKEAKMLKKVLKVPGDYNVYNALSALTVARALKIPDKISFKALSEYKGAWRRFEIKKGRLDSKNFTIISDYAHHPTEVKAALKASREKFPNRKIWCVFQPHQYQRTFYLFNDFVKVFSEKTIDRIIITDIYDVAGREEKRIKEKVSSRKLVEAINKLYPPKFSKAKLRRARAIYLPKEEIKSYLKENLKSREAVIIMGAGNIYTLVDEFSTQRV